MYKILLLFLFFARAISCLGQDTLPRFAIASLPAIRTEGSEESLLYYSNGHKEDLGTILNLEPQKGRYNAEVNTVIVTTNEFKTLEYMRSKGYELLSIYYDKGGHNRFYFERK